MRLSKYLALLALVSSTPVAANDVPTRQTLLFMDFQEPHRVRRSKSKVESDTAISTRVELSANMILRHLQATEVNNPIPAHISIDVPMLAFSTLDTSLPANITLTVRLKHEQHGLHIITSSVMPLSAVSSLADAVHDMPPGESKWVWGHIETDAMAVLTSLEHNMEALSATYIPWGTRVTVDIATLGATRQTSSTNQTSSANPTPNAKQTTDGNQNSRKSSKRVVELLYDVYVFLVFAASLAGCFVVFICFHALTCGCRGREKQRP